MTKIATIIKQFDESINCVGKSNPIKINCLDQKIRRTKDCLNELRQVVRLSGFESPKEEIYFFKKQKPYITGRLRFYIRLNEYFLERPVGTKSKIRKHINLQLSSIRNQNCKYNDFINYYKLENTNNDKVYFLRGKNQFDLFIDNTTIFEDPEFCTLRDNLASIIIANDLLNQFYAKELESLKPKKTQLPIQEIQNTQNNKIPWTGTTTQLIEFLYAANSEGAIGNGTLSIKQIEEICINNFGVNPGNIYNTIEQIKARKSNSTKFIDKLKTALLKEVSDQHNKL